MADFDRFKEDLKADKRLSDFGRKERIEIEAAQVAKNLEEKRRKFLLPLKQQLSEKIAELSGIRPREKSDASGELRDAELRTWFHGLTGDHRMQALYGVLAGKTPELGQALARAPH